MMRWGGMGTIVKKVSSLGDQVDEEESSKGMLEPFFGGKLHSPAEQGRWEACGGKAYIVHPRVVQVILEVR